MKFLTHPAGRAVAGYWRLFTFSIPIISQINSMVNITIGRAGRKVNLSRLFFLMFAGSSGGRNSDASKDGVQE